MAGMSRDGPMYVSVPDSVGGLVIPRAYIVAGDRLPKPYVLDDTGPIFV